MYFVERLKKRWGLFVREGGRKLDNWGEHAVTCQRYHIENMSFVRSG